jgi:putative membrane protein
MSLAETIIDSFLDRKLAQTPNTTQTQGQVEDRSFAKGLVAGLVAGVVATAAKSAVEKIYPPRVQGEPEPPAVLAEKVAGHELAAPQKLFATEAIHWGFGATIGAAYGTLAEFYPAATSREGVNFGMTLMALTHESTLPAMGLSAAPANQTRREKTSEMASHIVFGLVAETTRRIVRKML